MVLQERTGLRIRHREGAGGPPDDLDLEWDKLTEAARAAGYASDTEGNRASPVPSQQIVRPQFPPPALALEVGGVTIGVLSVMQAPEQRACLLP